MATTYTTNYNLGKQENHADKFDMDVITDNADKIDAALTGLQSGIDGKQATLTTAQLAAVNSGIDSDDVDQITTNKNNILSLRAYGGLKNYATINNGTYTANSGGGTHSIIIPLLKPITGDIVISLGNITSNDVDSSTCAFVLKNDSTNLDTVAVSRGDNINVPVSMGTFVATKFEIYPAATYQTSSGDTVSWTDLMICTKEDWDNSHDYQPYALSNVELTEKVAIKENKFSTTSMASLIYNEAIAQGIDTNNTLTYILSVRTDTDNEYVCAYGVYKHGVMHRCVAMVNNTITISEFNNLGTIALSGGTAPYYAKVKFF